MRFSFSKVRFSGRVKRRGAFGLDAAIMIGFILAMMLLLATAGPGIIQLFANGLLGGSSGTYTLLIELPILSSERPVEGASAAKWVGWAADSMSSLMQTLAFGLLAVVLIISAMCYLLETFRIMHEGTALNIIMNSVFTLILIFAVKHIYNGVAAAVNALTGWPDVGGTGLIIQSGGEIDLLIGAMGGGVLSEGWDVLIRFFGSVVIFIIAVSLLMLATMMGAVRLMLVGCLAAALPLLLMLRLIPPVKHLADSLIETVIGIIFASIITAILVHFGCILVYGTSLSGITKLVIALATFAGAAYMSTMFAGRLGGLFVTMGGMASTASSMATGLMLGVSAMGAGMVTGGVTGALRAPQAGLTGAGRLIGALRGAGAGLATTAAQVLPGAITGRGPGRVIQAAVSAMPSAVESAGDALQKRAGSTMENLIYSFGATPYPGENPEEGARWYRDAIEGKSDRQVGELFVDKTGILLDPEKAGAELKKMLNSVKDNPVILDRMRRHLEDFSKLSKKSQFEAFKDANDNWFANKMAMRRDYGKAFYDPNLEALDMSRSEDYYDRILSHQGTPGKIAKARTYELMRRGYDPSQLNMTQGYDFYRKVVYDESGNRRSDEDVGAWVRDNLGVRAPDYMLSSLGHEYKDLLDTTLRSDPMLLANLSRNLEAAEGFRGVTPDAELASLEESSRWVQEHARVPPGAGYADFWQTVGFVGRARPSRPATAVEKEGRFRRFYETFERPQDVFEVDKDSFRGFWESLPRTGAPKGGRPGKGKKFDLVEDREELERAL
jgi:hypothetical protein